MSEQPVKRRRWTAVALVLLVVVLCALFLDPCPPGKPVPAAVPAAPQAEKQERKAEQPVSHVSASP